MTRRAAMRKAAAERESAQEAFRILRSNLAVTIAEGDNRCVVLTSALEHEGKSSTSVAIAQSLSAAGSRVVLVDLDLRAPSVHTLLGVRADLGVSDVLLARRPLEDCVQQVSSRGGAGEGGTTFRVLAAGPSVPNPTELLSRPALGELLAQLAADADVVLIDAPPVLAVADALVVGGHTAGALLVVEAGRTTVPTIKQAKETLAKGRVRLLGVVLNRFDPRFALGRVDRVGWYGPQSGAGAPAGRATKRWLVPAIVAALALAAVGAGAGLVAARDDGSAGSDRSTTTTAPTTTSTTIATTTSAPPEGDAVPEGEPWDGSARLLAGDQVLMYTGGPGTLELRHAGNGRFRARAYRRNGESVEVVDGTGPLVDRFAIRRGPVTLVVRTAGGWGAVVSAAPPAG